MNSSLMIEPGTRSICVQSCCLFKRSGFNVQYLAGFLLRILGGESPGNIVSESEQIEARPQCTPCALRVMQGRKANLTEEEWDHLADLGRWHHRRQRRRKHWGYLRH